ncbi:MAG: oligosaccharide flippase family protein [Nitriliruptoraceae bacterium]
MNVPQAPLAGMRFSTSRIVRNTAARVVTATVGQGMKGIIAILVARQLGAAAFGTFSIVWTVTSIAAYYSALGIDNLLTRELSRRVPLIDVRRTVPIVSWIGASSALLLIAGGFFFTEDMAFAFLVAAPYVALTAPILVLTATFDARERMEFTSLAEAIEATVSLIAAVFALRLGGGIVGVLAALSFGRSVGVITAWLMHRRLPPLPTAPTTVDWRTIVHTSLPIGGVRLLTALYYRADIVILGLVVTATQVGLYSAAAITVMLVADGLSELGRAAYPSFSRASGRQDPELRASFALIWKTQLYLTLAAAAGLIALGGPLASDVFGAEFTAAGPLLAVMAASLVLRVLGNLGGISLYAVDRQADRLSTVAAATVVKLLLLALLVPLFQLWGAVAAAILADIVYIAAMLWFVRSFRPRLLMDWVPALVTALLVGSAAWLTPGPTAVRVAAGIVVFLTIIRVVSGKALVTMVRDKIDPPLLPDAVQVGPILVRLQGTADLSRAVIARSLAQLPPAAGGTTATLTIAFSDTVEATGTEVYGYPLRRSQRTLIAVDHAGRTAQLPLGSLATDPIILDPHLETDTFQSWVQLPILRATLHRVGWCLARMTVVDIHGRRIAIVADAATGKTRVALALLQRGATFVGDDWVALGPDGVAAACSLVVLRDQTRQAIGRFNVIDRIRSKTARALGFAAKRCHPWRKFSLALAYGELMLWRWGTEVVDIKSLVSGVEIASTIAPIDLVAVLDGTGGDNLNIDCDAMAEVIASRAIIDLPSAVALEAIYRAGMPGNGSLEMPHIDDDVALIAAALRSATVEVFAIENSEQVVARVADHIVRWTTVDNDVKERHE